MSKFEVRYKGALIEHFETESEAQGYRTRRLSHEVEGPAFAAKDLTVGPRRPVSLFCHGNLVDTFVSDGDATAHRDKLLAKYAEMKGAGAGDRGHHYPTVDDFEVTRSSRPKPLPDPPAPAPPAQEDEATEPPPSTQP